MFHIVLILLSATLLFMCWHLVHASPTSLARILPAKLTFGIGMFLVIFGAFIAFCSALTGDAGGILGSFVQVVAGLWFMLAISAGMRGSEEDERMLKRLFLMVGLVMTMMIVTLYLPGKQSIAVLNLLLVTSGFWMVTNYFQQLDRGR